MEAAALSVGKSVLDAALSYTRSAVSEEVALQLHIQRDHAFVRDELEMMRSFMMAAHKEQDNDRVLKTWVKQVRDVAYDVEDCLQDFSVHLDKRSGWPLARLLLQRRRIAKKMKELRERVEDVSQRNMRYQLFKGAGSNPATAAEQSSITAASIFGIDEARHVARQQKSRADLVHLISRLDQDLGVITVWGTNGDLGQMSIIRAAYENVDVKRKFPCRAWVRVMDPFSPKDFVQSMVKQFDSAVGVDVLLDTEKTLLEAENEQLVGEFNRYVNENSYLIVLNNVCTIEQWDRIKVCFPNNMRGSRIIVSTTQVEVASLCPGKEIQVLELNQLSADQTLYAFYEKGSQDAMELMTARPTSNAATTSANNSTLSTSEMSGIQPEGAAGNNAARNSRINIRTNYLDQSQLIGRDQEKSDIIELILNQTGQELPVISVWGMGGVGKTTLVKDAYQSQNLSSMFERRACVTVMHPFIPEELLKSIVMQLDAETSEKRSVVQFWGSTRKSLAMMGVEELIAELVRLLERKRSLIVLDDLSSTVMWDWIIRNFPRLENTSRIIVTTREENIARHCSSKQENVYKLNVLQYKDALDLFTKKVFKETTDLDDHPELIDEAKLILKKCEGLPLALVTIGGFLANQPKTLVEWRKLNKHLSAELDMNLELEPIKSILRKSYDGLPYHLKLCFLYLSIFLAGHKVNRRRLERRWIAEGYSRDICDKSMEEVASNYLMELIDRSMIVPSQQSAYSRKEFDSCHVHDLMHEIGISKSLEENLIFRLEEGCSSNTQGMVRHLAISSNWKGDKSEFESIVDLSRIRSLTVFGTVKPFFISEKMRLLRVLDLEGTEGLVDHHLEQISELYHLKYLSLRGCGDIYCLPDSFGNLRQLQTLDIAFTNVRKLPKTITGLTKLQNFCAGSVGVSEAEAFKETVEDAPKLLTNRPCVLTVCSLACCVAWCAPQLLKRRLNFDGEPNRHDVCTVCCCSLLPLLAKRESVRGVQLPKGIRKLKALQTMGLVNLAQGKKILHDIKRLTRLRKLAVTGISRRNAQELWSAIANLSFLESLLLRAEGNMGLLGCLIFGTLSPPRNLQSLKLYGTVWELPTWIEGLHNLVKLTLRSTRLRNVDAAIEALGKLPNLTILRLRRESFLGHELRFSFRGEAFPSLTVMEFDRPFKLQSVEFHEVALPKLELLNFCAWNEDTRVGLVSGLPYLTSLKEFTLSGCTYDDDFVEDLRAQIARNPNRPIFKTERSAAVETSPSVEQS
ncbi:unnamed protein product [Urochloa decumbens]|uniref:Uncharacterized protein n=1 Tax=Urochloa decumbens TaxID=240449 RepID=A0ABC8VJH4_9POAL